MQAKQFFALFLLVIVSVDAMIPEAQSNTIATKSQSKQVGGAASSSIRQTLNKIQKGLVTLPKQEIGLLFESDSQEGWSMVASGISGLSMFFSSK